MVCYGKLLPALLLVAREGGVFLGVSGLAVAQKSSVAKV